MTENNTDRNFIDPIRVMQWEVEGCLSKTGVLIDGLLYSKNLLPEQMEALYKIKLTDLRLLARIRNYAEFYSTVDATSRLRLATYNAEKFFSKVVGKILTFLEGKDISIELSCEVGDKSVVLDSRRTKIILYNLLSNAIIHSGRKSISIKVDVYVRGDYLVIDITDNGKCISEDRRRKLFELEEMMPVSKPEDLSMLKGLGLAVSRKLAREMDGDVLYVPSSRYNRFEVTISQNVRYKYLNEDVTYIADSEETEMYMAEAIISLLNENN